MSHGSGRVVEGLIRELRRTGGVHITLVAAGGSEADQRAMRESVDAFFPAERVDVAALGPAARAVESLRSAWFEYARRTPRFAAKMVRASFERATASALATGPFDVIQAEIGGLASVVDLLPTGTPTILVDHEAGTPNGGALADEPLTFDWVRRTYPRWDHVVALTEADARILGGVVGRDVSVRPVGVEVPTVSASVEPGSVLFFGSAEHAPNLDALRRLATGIWPRVVAARPDAVLKVAMGAVPDDLGTLISRAGIRHLGFVRDIHALVASTAVVVAPLRLGGGIRIKNLEALAAGRPLVTTATGASGIGIVDGLHGRLAEDDAGIAAAIVDLLAHPEDAEALGGRGRALVARRCSHAAAADWTLEMWRRVRSDR